MSRLSEIESDVHCDVCNISFGVNCDRQVELTFRPNAAIRAVLDQDFCVGGPQVTPHIAVQQHLEPGAERTLTPSLEEGRYRLRTQKLRGGQFIVVQAEGQDSLSLPARTSGWPKCEVALAPRSSIRFENETDSEPLFILERMAWADDSVNVLQVFRDPFSREALRPNQQFSVGSLAVVFTDLQGSTRLYREIGDAVAFGMVMDHFEVLKKAVSKQGGAIVKTLGDSIMAVFRRPVAALSAIQQAQTRLAAASPELPRLRLKASIHYGPCIAVTLHESLDYFGSTVNIAARLQGLSCGGEVVPQDPEVADFLEGDDTRLSDSLQTSLKGLEQESFTIHRLNLMTPRGDSSGW